MTNNSESNDQFAMDPTNRTWIDSKIARTIIINKNKKK